MAKEPDRMPDIFHALHALSHERNVIVGVDRALRDIAAHVLKDAVLSTDISLEDYDRIWCSPCPACSAGYSPYELRQAKGKEI